MERKTRHMRYFICYDLLCSLRIRLKVEEGTRFFVRNLAQGIVPEVPYFRASNDQIVVLNVP